MTFLPEELEFKTNLNIIFGSGLTSNLDKILKKYNFSKIGLIIDGNLYDNNKKLSEIIKKCEKSFDKVIVHLYREEFEPTYDFLDKLKLKFKKNKTPLVDCIVGIGGGSVIDTAKGIATLATNHKRAIAYRGFPDNLKKSLPIIAIPSTAGTGSEVTYNAVFINLKEEKKLGINSVNNYPFLSILDPEIVSVAPKSVAVSSGIDALVHVLESYVSKKSNYLTRIFASEAFGLIINSLPKLIDDLDDLELWKKMQLAASLAMISLSNSSSGPTGGLSYLLGTKFKVPHGIAGAVFIGRIMRINHEQGYYGLSDLYSKLEKSKEGISKKDKSLKVVEEIEKLLKKLNIPKDLRGFGVNNNHYKLFYDFAVSDLKVAFSFNPVKIGNNKIKELLNNMIGR